MKRYILILCMLITKISFSQNTIIMNSAFARPGDTITASVNISNTDRFISFQFDLPLPENVSFLGYSIQMSERSTNHVAVGNISGANLLRIFAYSPDNSAFLGNNGEVVSFQLVVGNIRGEFPMNPQNCIIGDSLSRNIITGIENGILSVFPIAVEEIGKDKPWYLVSYPNPARGNVTIRYQLPEKAKVIISIANSMGEIIGFLETREKQSGEYILEWNGEDAPSGVYYCLMHTKSKREKELKHETKIVLIK